MRINFRNNTKDIAAAVDEVREMTRKVEAKLLVEIKAILLQLPAGTADIRPLAAARRIGTLQKCDAEGDGSLHSVEEFRVDPYGHFSATGFLPGHTRTFEEQEFSAHELLVILSVLRFLASNLNDGSFTIDDGGTATVNANAKGTIR